MELMLGSQQKVNDTPQGDISYIIDDPKIARVDKEGIIYGQSFGDTTIRIKNNAGRIKRILDIRVLRPLSIQNQLPTYKIDARSHIIIDRESGQYIGHPDTVLLDDDQTILTVYPLGHGRGEAVINRSFDQGRTWQGRKTPNETWKDSRETPTIYKLNFTNGDQKLISISGGEIGWRTSLSLDDGETWSDYKQWYRKRETIVAMSSLVKLKDGNGNWLDKWMGVYHDHSFINYKTYLTFTEEGEEQWSPPEPYLEGHRDLEKTVQLCEACIFRSPDEKRLTLLARSQSHMHRSTISFSYDEGKTWTRPREVPGSLNGERHKATYDPVSGRLVICFREIILDYNEDGLIEDDDWMAGDWVAWVGTYEDLVNGQEGEFRILLGEDFTPSRKSGDCGYAGNIVTKDGTFFLNSYGYFDDEEVKKLGTDAKPYVIGVRFKLKDFA